MQKKKKKHLHQPNLSDPGSCVQLCAMCHHSMVYRCALMRHWQEAQLFFFFFF